MGWYRRAQEDWDPLGDAAQEVLGSKDIVSRTVEGFETVFLVQMPEASSLLAKHHMDVVRTISVKMSDSPEDKRYMLSFMCKHDPMFVSTDQAVKDKFMRAAAKELKTNLPFATTVNFYNDLEGYTFDVVFPGKVVATP